MNNVSNLYSTGIEIVQIKRVCYEGEDDLVFTKRRIIGDSGDCVDTGDNGHFVAEEDNVRSPTKKRRIGGHGAKRLKKNE